MGDSLAVTSDLKNMRVSLLSAGSRGDVQPFLALAWALRERGHNVRLAVPANFLALCAQAGFEAYSLGVDAEAMLASDLGRQALIRGDLLAFAQLLLQVDRLHDAEANRGANAAMEGADVAVSNVLVAERAAAFATKGRIPLALVCAAPLAPTGAFPCPLLTTWNPGIGWLNRWVSELILRLVIWTVRHAIRDLRASLGVVPFRRHALSEADRRGGLVLHAWSEALVERPFDYAPNHLVTGFWGVPPGLRAAMGETELDPAANAWLDAGPRPTFFGFGSMPVQDPQRTLTDIATAAERTGTRALVSAGWSNLNATDTPTLLVRRTFDHARVMPRCAGALHHGGAGTTAASLTAGLPTWVCAVLAEQPWWGARCAALGVGGWSRLRDADADRFTRAIQVLQRPEAIARAAAIGERLRAEDGLATAVSICESVLPTTPPPD